MSEILITWRELDAGAFPDCCMTCGADDTALVPWKLATLEVGVFANTSRRTTVDLPFCRRHERQPWLAMGQAQASRFTEDGVWMTNLSPVFIEALWEKRERLETKERRKKRELDEKYPWEGHRDEDDERRPTRPRRGDPAYQKPSYTWVWILVSVLVLFGLFAIICAGMLLSGAAF